jgi:carbohydrate diacid regulator
MIISEDKKMFDRNLAQRLINKISKQFGYNINVMDDKGIIIASVDSSRIGEFHQGAYDIIHEKIPLRAYKDVDEKIIGVKPGIIMTTYYRNTIIGVVGVTGDPDVLMPFAKLVKLAFETMYEYELQKENAIRAKLQWDSFLDCLLYKEPRNIYRIKKLSDDAGFEEKYPRIPIIIKSEAPINPDKVVNEIKNLPSCNKQDIISALEPKRVLVFKTFFGLSVSETKKYISLWADEISAAFSKIEDINTEKTAAPSFFAGTPQANFEYYNKSFQHAEWLENFLGNTAERVNFFVDYLMEYNASQLSKDMFDEIFNIYRNSIKKDTSKEMIVETVQAFLDSNMNLNDTAAKLFVHRNTVVFRLKKIKKLFGIEPVKNSRDTILLFYLLYYFKYCL